MILTGNSIITNYQNNKIVIKPYKKDHVNPNSYDVTLGSELLVYESPVLDTKTNNDYKVMEIGKEGVILRKGHFYLGHTQEIIGSEHFVPLLHNKSGIARLGLFIHVTADLIDIGSIGNLTLQLHPTMDIKVYPTMRIGQVSFWHVDGTIVKYEGKYQNSVGPVASKIYKNFENEESIQ